MAGKEKWTDPKVTAVFQKWAEILPYHAKDYAGLTWQQTRPTPWSRRSPGCTCSACSCRRSSRRPRSPADIAALDFFPFPNLGTAVRRREGARRADRHLADRGQVAEPRDRDRRRQGVPRVLGEGFDPGHHVQGPAGPHPDRQGRGHQHVQRPAEEGRRGRPRPPSGSPSSSTATRAPTSPARTACRASCRSSSPNPTQDLAAYQTSIQAFWDQLPPLK